MKHPPAKPGNHREFTMTSVQSENLWRQIAKDRKAIGIRRLSAAETVARFMKKIKKQAPKPAP